MKEEVNRNFIKNTSDDIEVKRFNNVISRLDLYIEEKLSDIDNKYKKIIEEVRLRVNKPLMLNMSGIDIFIDKDGNLLFEDINSFIVNKEMIDKTFEKICEYSIYAVEDEIRNGFVTIKGGHRIGISGKSVYKNNSLFTIKDISSINIRISRQKIGVSNKVIKYIIHNKKIYNTLIVSPPQCGKTTLLRDIIRNLSNGIPQYNFSGLKVAVIDERSEIAASYRGIPQNDIGIRTDVLDSSNKYDGTMMMLRSLSPQVIATDELGANEDIKAIHNCIKAGVKIITTIHGEDLEDIKSKPNISEIIKEKIFERIIILDNSNGVGTIKEVIDGKTYNAMIKNKGGKDVSIKNYSMYNDSYT